MTDQQQHHLSVAIIGDAFADLFCFLGDSTLPKPGGDARLTQPIRTVAGGSGLNTATHCSSLGRSRSAGTGSRSGTMDVSLHTVLNESDDYGRLLTSHAKRHGFDLVNCRRALDDSGDNSSSSTGHCTVIVSKGERSFMTHLGCVSAFKADHVDVDGVLGLLGTRGNESNNSSYSKHHLHVHIAGYYNIDGFFDGQLKRLLQTIRDRRGSGITISLVPQHDATEKWDGGLLDLLPLVNYLICSELEAECIANIAASTNTSRTATPGTSGSNDILQQMASFFHRASPKTCVVVTLGPKGAVALRGGEIVHRQEAPVNISDPVDPTGAGDAFAAGFLHGIHRLRGKLEIGDDDDTSILRNGLFHGCLLGTSCVMRAGASTPATSDELEALIQKSSSAGEMS